DGDRLRDTTELRLPAIFFTRRAPPLPPDLPLDLRAIVAKALDKNSDERYQSMRDLVIDLKRVLQASPAETKERRTGFRRRWMLPALAFVIAASSAVYVLRQNDYF